MKHWPKLGSRTLICSVFVAVFSLYPSNFVPFRKRIGKQGIAKIAADSVDMDQPKTKTSKFVLSDTAVQENTTTFPTDAKWCKKVIDYCNKIARKENIAQRQRYTRVSKQLLRDTYNGKHPDGLVYGRDGKGKNTDQRHPNCYAFSTKKTDTPYQKRVMRKKFRTRAAIEPIIGHLKTDFRVA